MRYGAPIIIGFPIHCSTLGCCLFQTLTVKCDVEEVSCFVHWLSETLIR